uniref:C2 domain-containing protein n=1 Tax=Panagrellus redivivus TaxID=6233 RepID=A0A7E5A1F4_PANRE
MKAPPAITIQKTGVVGASLPQKMNFLAKHFFDYQSFVNLPYKAVQLHKTPPSQAGSDPTASWAPKSMQVAGKNQPAHGARANRNNVEVRPGGHRHGRPSKLEFREWGERHGELHPEKNVPHKDPWMVSLDGDFKHYCEDEEEPVAKCDFIPKLINNTKDTNYQLLIILTYAPQVEFVTITVKKLRGFGLRRQMTLRVRMYEGISVIEEKQVIVKKLETQFGNHVEANHIGNHVMEDQAVENEPHPIVNQNGHRPGAVPNGSALHGSGRNQFLRPRTRRPPLDEEICESFLMKAAPSKLNSIHIVVQVFDTSDDETALEDPLGQCIIGLACGSSRGIFHWRQMMRKHGTPVCMWHRIMKSTATST